MLKKSPAFQFYASDFLSDIRVVTMTMRERGIYITLLAHSWIEKGLPSDPEILRRLCSNPEGWEEAWENVSKCFTEKGDNLVSKRLELERSSQAKWRKKMVEAGKKGAKRRWDSQAIAKPLPSHSPSSSSSLSIEEEPNGSSLVGTKNTPTRDLIRIYHANMPNNPLVRKVPLSNGSQAIVRARWRENPSIQWFGEYFEYCHRCPWLRGENNSGWVANFIWLMRPSNMEKVINGNYESKDTNKLGYRRNKLRQSVEAIANWATEIA